LIARRGCIARRGRVAFDILLERNGALRNAEEDFNHAQSFSLDYTLRTRRDPGTDVNIVETIAIRGYKSHYKRQPWLGSSERELERIQRMRINNFKTISTVRFSLIGTDGIDSRPFIHSKNFMYPLL
jgi:hypothetical protein